MVRMTFHCAVRLTAPSPKRDPQETWVVDTGSPNVEAIVTRQEVTRLAVNPCPWFIGVMRWLMVTATFRAFRNPPAAMAMPTATIPVEG